MNETVERLKRKLTAQKSIKDQRRDKNQEVAEYFQPDRAIFYGVQTSKEEDRELIFDSTPEDAAEALAANLHSSCTSPTHEWFGLASETDDGDLSQEDKEWLETAEKKMLAKFNSEDTNFHTSIHEFFLDYPIFGIGGLYVDNPKRGEINFICDPVASVTVAENAAGRVDTVFREFQWTSRQIFERWPKTCSDPVREAYEKDNCNQKFKVIHVIEPRKNYKEPKEGQKIIPAKSMPIASYYFEEASGIMLEESGFFEMPYIAPRWGKHAADPYGRGIGLKMLPDVRVLNEVKRSMLIAAEKQADPTTLLPHDGFIGNWGSEGGALNFHRITGNIRDKVMTIGSEARLDVFEHIAEQSRTAIRKGFLNDRIAPANKEMTATEFVGTYNQNMLALGPVYGRFQTEGLSPLIFRVLSIMIRDGEIDTPPESLGGQKFKIKYLSPVSRAQQKMGAQAFTEAMNYLMPLAQVSPSVASSMQRIFDSDEVVRDTQGMFGYAAKYLKSVEKLKKEDAAAAAAQQQQNEIAKKAQELELAGKAKEVNQDAKASQ